MSEEAERAVERAARDSYGRLLAYVSSRCRDLQASEDALADAFHSALVQWPRIGVPTRPEGWLLTVARRRLIDRARRVRVAEAALMSPLLEAEGHARSDENFPDERLKMLFLCAHPAIHPSVRTPLMLQTVLGFNAAQIASAFLIQPSAMGQRLSRAKTKIRDARIRFELPELDQLPARLDAVLDAIYAAYGSGWDRVAGGERQRGLATEAVYLGRTTVQLLTQQPEALGLLSLMLHCEARRNARRQGDRYVPLSEQDVSLWDRHLIAEAEACLAEAAQWGKHTPGRFQLEAAIQSAHASRQRSGTTDWSAIALLYEGLVRLSPTLGAQVGRAAAVAEAFGPGVGLALLEQIGASDYQPYWALKAHLLKRLRRSEEASSAYLRAIGLCQDESARAFLLDAAASLSPAWTPEQLRL